MKTSSARAGTQASVTNASVAAGTNRKSCIANRKSNRPSSRRPLLFSNTTSAIRSEGARKRVRETGLTRRPEQFVHTHEFIAAPGELVEQFTKARVEFVRASRPRAQVQQQDEAVQPVRVLAFTGDDAVENLLRRNKVLIGLAGVIRVRARAGREADERPA